MPILRLSFPRRGLGVGIGAPTLAGLVLLASTTGQSQSRPTAPQDASPPARTAQAFPQRLDEGSFTILVHGQRVGREQFSVQQVNGSDGVVFELRAESALGDRRSAMRLEADSAGSPVRYSLEERLGAEQALRLGGQRIRGRFTTLSRSVNGESAREYLLRPGAVVVEDEGLVQNALLVRTALREPGEAITRPSITLTANSQGPVHVVLESTADTVTIAGSRRMARRWRVVTAASDVRMVWTDPEGRLLRIFVPARDLDARRDDVPR